MAVGVDVLVAVGAGVSVAGSTDVLVAVGTGVSVTVGTGVLVAVGRGVSVTVGTGVLVAVGTGVLVAVGADVLVAVGTGVLVMVGTGVSVKPGVGVAVATGERVSVVVGVGMIVPVGDGVAVGAVVSVGTRVGRKPVSSKDSLHGPTWRKNDVPDNANRHNPIMKRRKSSEFSLVGALSSSLCSRSLYICSSQSSVRSMETMLSATLPIPSHNMAMDVVILFSAPHRKFLFRIALKQTAHAAVKNAAIVKVIKTFRSLARS